jgi:hypothetical protein
MRLASGEYLLYLNCDDIFCDNRVLVDLYAFVRSHHRPDWIVGRWYVRRLNGAVEYIQPQYPFAGWHLFLAARICHQGVLLKREIQEKVGGFNTDFRIGMDYDLWARLHLAGYKVTNFIRPLVVYADGGFSVRHEDIAHREYRDIKTRLRNTPLKRVVGTLYDSLWRYYEKIR